MSVSQFSGQRYSDFSPSGLIIFTLNHPRILVRYVVKMEEGRYSVPPLFHLHHVAVVRARQVGAKAEERAEQNATAAGGLAS